MNKQYADAAAYEKKLQKMGKQMKVKDLKDKLDTLPENAEVRFMSDYNDGLLEGYFCARKAVWFEELEEDGEIALYLLP